MTDQEFRAAVAALIAAKLAAFWEVNSDIHVPYELPDAVPAMAERACDWIAAECDALGTQLAGEG